MIGVVFQVGGNYKSFDESVTIGGITATATADLKVHEFLGGVRLSARSNSAVVPFGQVLVGGINGSDRGVRVHDDTRHGPHRFQRRRTPEPISLYEAGGGVNFKTERGASASGPARTTCAPFEDEGGANLFRFHVGIVIGR